MEKLQYELTFKTRKEGNGAEQTAAAVRDLRAEAERIEKLETPEKLGFIEAAYYDLDAAVTKTLATTRKEGVALGETDLQRAKAMQTVRRIREEMEKEEARLKALEVQQTKAAGNYKNLGGAAAMAAFQVQDAAIQLQAGVNWSTVIAQQLPQLLMIFGPGGAIAGGVIALGALAYKMATTVEGTEEATKAQQAYNDKLKELIDLKADQFASAYVDHLKNINTQLGMVADAEVKMLAARNQVAAQTRDAQSAQDDLLKSYLVYQQTVNGVDTSAEQKALQQRQLEREAENAIAAHNAKLEEQQAAYDAVLEKIRIVQESEKEMDAQRQALETKSSNLGADLRIANAAGNTGEAASIQQRLAETNRTVEELKEQIAGAPAEVERLSNLAHEMGIEIDTTRLTSASAIEKINADLEAKTGKAELDAAIEKNKETTNALGTAIDDFKAQTPVQQEAVKTIQAALEDGKISAQESAAVASALRTLLSTLTTQNESNRSTLNNLVAIVEANAAAQKATDQRVQALMNRQ